MVREETVTFGPIELSYAGHIAAVAVLFVPCFLTLRSARDPKKASHEPPLLAPLRRQPVRNREWLALHLPGGITST